MEVENTMFPILSKMKTVMRVLATKEDIFVLEI
jgi:hypothetical protein